MSNIPQHRAQLAKTPVRVPIGSLSLEGDFGRPSTPRGLIVFAHGSGSSRHSSRNRYVAGVLEQNDFATLLIDLLTAEEEAIDLLVMGVQGRNAADLMLFGSSTNQVVRRASCPVLTLGIERVYELSRGTP